MIEWLDFFLALLNFLSELIRSIEVLADVNILSEFLDFFKLSVKVNEFFVEDLLLVFKFLR